MYVVQLHFQNYKKMNRNRGKCTAKKLNRVVEVVESCFSINSASQIYDKSTRTLEVKITKKFCPTAEFAPGGFPITVSNIRMF